MCDNAALYSKYGCHGVSTATIGCSQSYSLALRSSWTSGGSTFDLYDITLTATASSDFSTSRVIAGFTLGSSAVITQTWGMTHADAELYTIDFGSDLQAGSSWTGSGFVVQNAPTPFSMFIEEYECDQTSYLTYIYPLCHGSTTTATASSSSSSTSGTSSTGPSDCSPLTFLYTLQSSWQGGSQWTVTLTNTGSKAVTQLDMTAPASSIAQIWQVSNPSAGHYGFPTYVTSLAPGQALTFGYVSADANKVDFTVAAC